MPRTYDPHADAEGTSSSALKIGRRRKKKPTTIISGSNAAASDSKVTMIGEGLLAFDDSDASMDAENTQNSKTKSVSRKKNPRPPAALVPKKRPTAKPRVVAKARPLPMANKQRSAMAKTSPAESLDSPPQSPSASLSQESSMSRHQQETTLPVVPSSTVRHAMLVDTRTLDTEQGLAVSNEVMQHAHDLLRTLARRGVAPSFLGSSYLGDNKKNKRSTAVVEVQVEHVTPDLSLVLENLSVDVLNLVPVRLPANAGNTQNTGAVHVPKRLLAHDSWKLFADLVDKCVQEDKDLQASGEATSTSPIQVTILTHDVALFCDTKEHSHKLALNRFWERVSPAFQDNILGSIEIVVVVTGSIEAVNLTKDEKDVTKADSSSDEDDVSSSPKLQQSTKLMESIRCIKAQISKRADADLKKKLGYDESTSPTQVNIVSIDCNTVGFKSLASKWLRQVMRPEAGRVGKVAFDLPETVDGMQCSVSLDASYKIMPYRADSLAAAGMLADIQLLGESTFQVLQLIPISCVDASLLFGVPMEVRAELAGDLSQYKEMKSLVSLLLRYLCEKEAGLLLRSSSKGRRISKKFGPALYHVDRQIFLLMAEELPGRDLAGPGASQSMSQSDGALSSGKPIPSSGVLFRYANSEQMLDPGSNEAYAVDPTDDPETIKQLTECIENSLDFVENNSINPLLVEKAVSENDLEDWSDKKYQSTAALKEDAEKEILSDTSDEDEADVWAKETGVGTSIKKYEHQAMEDSEEEGGSFSYGD
jgi:hypothetical protein